MDSYESCKRTILNHCCGGIFPTPLSVQGWSVPARFLRNAPGARVSRSEMMLSKAVTTVGYSLIADCLSGAP